jgi:hypothetical protein
MPLFHVTAREHTYTGRFYHDVVEAGSLQQALQLAAGPAAAPQPPAAQPQREFNVAGTEHPPTGRPDRDVTPAKSCEQAQHPAAGPAAAPEPPAAQPQRGFDVAVTEHAPGGRSYTDVVEAGSFRQALQLAAERASVPHPPPVSTPQPGAAVRPRCADVWVYSLLQCELAEGHDPPHMAVAPGYQRPVRWVRDHRGLAHAPALVQRVTESVRQAGLELGEPVQALRCGVGDPGDHRSDDLVFPAGDGPGQREELGDVVVLAAPVGL